MYAYPYIVSTVKTLPFNNQTANHTSLHFVKYIHDGQKYTEDPKIGHLAANYIRFSNNKENLTTILSPYWSALGGSVLGRVPWGCFSPGPRSPRRTGMPSWTSLLGLSHPRALQSWSASILLHNFTLTASIYSCVQLFFNPDPIIPNTDGEGKGTGGGTRAITPKANGGGGTTLNLQLVNSYSFQVPSSQMPMAEGVPHSVYSWCNIFNSILGLQTPASSKLGPEAKIFTSEVMILQ